MGVRVLDQGWINNTAEMGKGWPGVSGWVAWWTAFMLYRVLFFLAHQCVAIFVDWREDRYAAHETGTCIRNGCLELDITIGEGAERRISVYIYTTYICYIPRNWSCLYILLTP
jgi:hypothetical protein